MGSDAPLTIGTKLEGAIAPINIGISATLYVKVPLWGRVKITSLFGILKQGINLDINILVASGTVGLKLVGHDVHIIVRLSVKFVGEINGDVKLFTLPYVLFPCPANHMLMNNLHADSPCTMRLFYLVMNKLTRRSFSFS